MAEEAEQGIAFGRAGTSDAVGTAYLFGIPLSDYVSSQVLVCGGGLNG